MKTQLAHSLFIAQQDAFLRLLHEEEQQLIDYLQKQLERETDLAKRADLCFQIDSIKQEYLEKRQEIGN